jgi:hypothetical protein
MCYLHHWRVVVVLPVCVLQDCVDLIEARPPAGVGILSMLDEECMVGGWSLAVRLMAGWLSAECWLQHAYVAWLPGVQGRRGG